MKVAIINTSTNQLPQYETPASAGMDIRADFSRVSVDNPIKVWGDCEIIFAGETHTKTLLRLDPGARALVPTGMFMAIPEGYEIQVRPRSGLALKKGLTVLNTPGTVDASYRNEIGVILINHGHETVWIEDGERIAQLVLTKVEQIEWDSVTALNSTDRTGGFGSTGIK